MSDFAVFEHKCIFLVQVAVCCVCSISLAMKMIVNIAKCEILVPLADVMYRSYVNVMCMGNLNMDVV